MWGPKGPLGSLECLKSTWGYENQVSKHFVMFANCQLSLSNSLTYVYYVAWLCCFFIGLFCG